MQLSEFQQRAQALWQTAQTDSDANWQTKYLGKKGLFKTLSADLRLVDDKKAAGEILNQLKAQLQNFASTLTTVPADNSTNLDLTLPPDPQIPQGHLHPITQAIEEIVDIFTKLGFVRVRHPELDLDENVFGKLNMAPNHPARDEWETFFVNHPGKKSGVAPTWVLTPHTSNGQVHEMARLGQPPVRMINISRCYRRQQDVTHTQMFHQFEGLVIDKGINITHLKGVLDYFAQQFYGKNTKSRIRPFHFQFTEPSFEIDFSCQICGGSGQVDGQKCKFCKSGWHEVGGAGMVHPNVLRAANFDPEIYTGFAFGWGIERTYTLRPNLNIDDIRNFYNGNLEFLSQF